MSDLVRSASIEAVRERVDSLLVKHVYFSAATVLRRMPIPVDLTSTTSPGFSQRGGEARAGAGRRSGRDHVARPERGESREISDQKIEREHQPLGGVLLPHLAIDAGDDVVRAARIQLVRSDDPRPDAAGSVEVLALGDVELAMVQPVAHAALVAQGHAEDVRPGVLRRDVTTLPCR